MASRSLVLLAIVLNLAMAIVLVIVVFVPVRITDHGPVKTSNRIVYVSTLTIFATTCRAFTSSQIRAQKLKFVDQKLSRGHELTVVDSEWRTAVGMGSIGEQVKYWRTTGSFIISILTVTAFITGLTATLAERTVPFSYALQEDSSYYCMGIGQWVEQGINIGTLQNGTNYTLSPFMDFCPTSQTMLIMGNINTVDPHNYAYGDGGVAVRSSSIGAPGSFYSPTYPGNEFGLQSLLDIYGADFLSATACAPILSDNPFQCQRISGVSYDATTSGLSIQSKDSRCQVAQTTGQDGYTWKLCPISRVGQMTLIIAHVGYYAIYAAEAMRDHAQSQEWHAPNFSGRMIYGVQCDVNVNIGYRQVILDLSENFRDSGPFARTLQGGPTCEIDKDFGKTHLSATAALGVYQPLSNGWLAHIRMVAISPNATNDFVRDGQYAFSNSRNALEDVLGLTAGLSLSRMTMTGRPPTVEVQGRAVIRYSRVGAGKPWALVFAIPPLVAAIILTYLWWKARKSTAGITESLAKIEKFVLEKGEVQAT